MVFDWPLPGGELAAARFLLLEWNHVLILVRGQEFTEHRERAMFAGGNSRRRLASDGCAVGMRRLRSGIRRGAGNRHTDAHRGQQSNEDRGNDPAGLLGTFGHRSVSVARLNLTVPYLV